MARLIGPDLAYRAVFLPSGAPAAGRTGIVYANAAGTILADILAFQPSTPTTPGAPIAGSQVVCDTYGLLPQFWFPDGADQVWISVNGGPLVAVGASSDERFDGLTARVTVLESGGGIGASVPYVDAGDATTAAGSAVALAGHEADTTNVHGIPDTTALETVTGAQAKTAAALQAAMGAVNTHTGATTNVHGIPDTALLETTAGATGKAAAAQAAAIAASDPAGSATAAVSAHTEASDPHGDRAAAAGALASHEADTTAVHGIPDTALLETTSGAQSKADTAQTAAVTSSAQRSANLSDLGSPATARTNLGLGTSATRNVGTAAGTVADGADSRLSDARTPTAHAASHASAGADPIAVAQSQVTGLTGTLAVKADLVSGVIPTSQIPAIAINTTWKAASQAAMLALPANNGDLAIRTDTSNPTLTFILSGANPAVLANWVQVSFGAVSAVNGQIGAVTLAAADVSAPPTSRQVVAGTGLTGGGDLTADRTLTVAYGTAAGTAAQGNDTRITGAAQKASNLADLASAATARTNLGLGGAAVLPVGTAASTVAAGDDTRFTSAAQKSANLSDLASAATARTNLGLGAAATRAVGTTAGTVPDGADSRFADARTPLAHAASHGAGGTDPITVAQSQVTGLGTALAGKVGKGESYVSIADYGTLGTADDRLTIQAAIDAAAVYGARVFVPTGTYVVSVNPTSRMCLYLKPGCKGIFGAGSQSIIKVKDGQGDYHSVMSTFSSAAGYGAVQNAAVGLEIHDLTIDQNNTGNHITNVAISGPLFAGGKPRICIGIGAVVLGQAIVRNVRCFDTDGVWTVYFQGRDFTMDGCEFVVSDTSTDHDQSALYTSVSVQNGKTTIVDNLITAPAPGNIGARTALETHGGAQNVMNNTVRYYQKAANLTGVHLYTGEGISWIGNRFLGCKFGIQLWSLDASVYHVPLSNVKICYNTFVLDPVSWTPTGGTYCCGIFLDVSADNVSSWSLTYSDFLIEGNDIRYMPGHVGVSGEHTNNGIEWRRTVAPTTPGTHAVGEQHDRNIRIINNYIEGAGANGIRYSSVSGDYIDGLVIAGNRVRNSGTFTVAAGGALSNSYGNGIMVAGTLRNSRIEDNEIVDDQATHTTNNGFYLAPTYTAGVNNIVRNNRVAGTNAPAYLFSGTIDGGYLLEADLPTWAAPTGTVALASQIRALDTGLIYRQTASPVGSTWTPYTPGQTGGTPPNIQTFTSSGTWTKPAGAVTVDVILIAGGGGGGSGRRGAAATIRCGGGGGGGGGLTQMTLPASALGATAAVTVGVGGAGAPAVTVDSTNGTAGSTGGNSQFGAFVKAAGGVGGGGGTTAAGAGGGGNVGTSIGGTGAASSTAGPGNAAGLSAGPPGGGGGGSIIASNVTSGGGASVSSLASPAGGTGGGAGVVDSTAPTAGGSVTAGLPLPGGGGGGGAASSTTAAQAGANGGLYGAAGGGGGASLNGNNSGKGGDGAAGIVVVITHF